MLPHMAFLRSGRGGVSGGSSNGSVNIADGTVDDTVTDPSDAQAMLVFTSAGAANGVTSGGTAPLTGWLSGSTNGAAYDIRATVTSGSLSSGTTGSWVNLGSNFQLTVSRTFVGTKSCTVTVEIGLAGTATALDSASYTLTATVDL